MKSEFWIKVAMMFHTFQIIRRIIIGIALWMVVDAYSWAKEFAAQIALTNPEMAQWAGGLVQAIPTVFGVAVLTSYARYKYQDGE